jgi:cytochrome c553
VTGLGKTFRLAAAAMVLLGIAVMSSHGRADWLDGDEGAEPWDRCAECHGLFGAGNRIKFPRLAGQEPEYIMKQLEDFRHGRRTNDGGQMQKTATEIKEADIPRVAKYFAAQTPPWPKPTIETEIDLGRARTLAIKGAAGMDACLSCHSEAQLGLLDDPIIAPRIAGQRDFYIAKQLREYRDGLRKNDPDQIMTKIARRLSDADIIGLAVFLSQNPQLHEEPNP